MVQFCCRVSVKNENQLPILIHRIENIYVYIILYIIHFFILK